MESDNLYEGELAHLKSIFPHSQEEVEAKKDEIKIQSVLSQEEILQKEFESQKIQPLPEKSNPLSTTRKEDLKNVNDMLRGVSKKDAEKINNSLMKRLSD